MEKVLVENIPGDSNSMLVSLFVETLYPHCRVGQMEEVTNDSVIFTFSTPLPVTITQLNQSLGECNDRLAGVLKFSEVEGDGSVEEAEPDDSAFADAFDFDSNVTSPSFPNVPPPQDTFSEKPKPDGGAGRGRGPQRGRGAGRGRGRGKGARSGSASQDRNVTPGGKLHTFCLTLERIKFLRSILKNNKILSPGSVRYKDSEREVVVSGDEQDIDEYQRIVANAIKNITSKEAPLSTELGQYLTVNPGSKDMLEYCQQKKLFCRLYIEDGVVMLYGREPRDCEALLKHLTEDYTTETVEADGDSGRGLTSFLKELQRSFPLTLVREHAGVFTIEGLDKGNVDGVKQEILGKVKAKVYISTVSRDVTVNENEFRILELHGSHRIVDAIYSDCGVSFRVEFRDKTLIRIEGPDDKMSDAEKSVNDCVASVAHVKCTVKKPGIESDLFDSGSGKFHHENLEGKHKCIIKARRTSTNSQRPQVPSQKSPKHENASAAGFLEFLAPRKPEAAAPTQAVMPKVKELSNLKVIQGDLTRSKARVLAVPIVGDNSDPRKCGAICKSFADNAGDDFCQRFSKVDMTDQGSIQSFPCGDRLIVCFRIGKWSQRSGARTLQDLLMQCVSTAKKNGGSIAFPTVGCGGMHYPVREVAEAFKKTAERFANIDITVLAFDHKMQNEFVSHLWPDKAGIMRRRPSTPTRPSVVAPRLPRVPCIEKVFEIDVWALGRKEAEVVSSLIKENIIAELYREERITIEEGLSEKCSDDLMALQSRKVKIVIDPHQRTLLVCGCADKVNDSARRAYRLIMEDAFEQKMPEKKQSMDDLQRGRSEMDVQSYLELTSEAEICNPAYWKNNPNQPVLKVLREDKTACRLTDVQLEGQSGKEILNLVHSTWKSNLVGHGYDAANLGQYTKLQVTKIERVENPKLWKTYATKRADLLFKASKGVPKHQPLQTQGSSVLEKTTVGEINEAYLFHGLQLKHLQGVQGQGVDPRLSGDRVLFGNGSYFAESSSKADQYTDDRQSRQGPGQPLVMLLCRVILGNAFECRDPKNFKRPPCTQCHDDKCVKHDTFHDSIIGISKSPSGPALLFREFVIYEIAQSYPEYIIHYMRQ